MTARSWALVTGASKGIGAATADALAAAGYDLLVHYGADAAGAEATAERCRSHGVEARTVAADLLEGTAPLTAAMDEVGGVRVLVNNAGVTMDKLAVRLTEDDVGRTFRVNIGAAMALSQHAVRAMLRARAGRIVNVTSVVGLHGNAGQSAYAASKAALVGLTKALAREVGSRSITVNAVAPGFVRSAMTAGLDEGAFLDRIPAGRLGEPEEIAAVITFLCSDGAAYVNGAVVQVDGGMFA